MARGATGSTTIVAPPVTGGSSTITSRAAVSLRRAFFTAADLSDPNRLYRIISDLQQFVYTAIRPLGQNPTLFGNIIGPYTFTGGQTLTVPHYLGRAFNGFYCIDAQTSDWSGHRVALPAGVTAAQMIAIKSSNSGTYTFMVW